MTTAIDIGDFIGSWSVQRTIVDHRGRTAYAFTGTARVTPSRFVEAGTIRIAGKEIPASRSYGLIASGPSLLIQYPDGSPFIEIDLTTASPVRHLCGEDDYNGRIIRRGPDSWAEHWRVRGPRKHYASLTRYRRCPDP